MNKTRSGTWAPDLENPSRKNDTLAAIGGIADCLVILAYILGENPYAFSGVGILIKLFIVIFIPIRPQSWVGESLPFSFVILSLVSLVASPYGSMEAIAQLAAVSIGLFLSVLIVADQGRLCAYGRAFSNTVCASSILYIILVIFGIIEISGRSTYFSGSHPNLGSEINSVAAIAACMFFRGRGLSIRIVILTIPVLFMQGRGALLTIIIAYYFSSLYFWKNIIKRNGSVGFFIILMLLLLILLLTIIGFTGDVIQSVFLLDDPYRGEGTGFTGRVDRWLLGYKLFLESPILGNSEAIYEARGILTPHSFFIYGFANLGIMFCIILGLLFFHGARVWKRDRRAALIMSSSVILMLLNDRFFNLNPYPFVSFVLFLGVSMLPLPRSGGGASLTPHGAAHAQRAPRKARFAGRRG